MKYRDKCPQCKKEFDNYNDSRFWREYCCLGCKFRAREADAIKPEAAE